MSTKSTLGLAFFVLFTPLLASAQEVNYERVLVPLVVETPIPGAFGSLWKTELVAYNNGERDVEVFTNLFCRITCPRSRFEPGEAWRPGPQQVTSSAGSFLWATPADLRDVVFNLRIGDVTGAVKTWGTQVPVVRESDATSAEQPITLLSVPVRPDYRTNVRIYDFGGGAPREFEIVFSREGTVLHALTMETVSNETDLPGYLFMNVEEVSLPPAGDYQISISPTAGRTPFWAFASVTHNESQHVTLVAPN